jgi:hypothetical protein
MGATVIGSMPKEYQENIPNNLAKLKKAIEIAGVKLE